MKSIHWIISYPKSGSTWFRIFLSNLTKDDLSKSIDINALECTTLGCSRALFDCYSCVSSGDLTQSEIDDLRPEIFNAFSSDSIAPKFVKLHESSSLNDSGFPLFPPEATAGALYIVRNPLDMVASLANHTNKSLDEAIDILNDENYRMGTSPDSIQLDQLIQSWSLHVNSWLDAAKGEYKLHLLKYEDMVANSVVAFTSAVRFLGLDHTTDEIESALEASSFETLKATEQAHGFREKPASSNGFFRKGKVGAWREELSESQVERVLASHGPTMKALGYLNPQGHPIF